MTANVHFINRLLLTRNPLRIILSLSTTSFRTKRIDYGANSLYGEYNNSSPSTHKTIATNPNIPQDNPFIPLIHYTTRRA